MLHRYGDDSIFSFRHVGSPNSYDDRNMAEGSSAEDESREPTNIVNIAIKVHN